MKGFRSFVDEQVTELPQTGNILLLGDSGAGKSTLLLAISYAFDYCPFPASAQQSWGNSDKMEVEVGFTCDEGDGVVTRGAKHVLKIGGVVHTGAEDVKNQLQRILGLDKDLRAALTYRPQDTQGILLPKSNSQVQDFFTHVLDLENVVEGIYEATKRANDFGEVERLATESLLLSENYLKVVESTKVVPLETFNPEHIDEQINDKVKEIGFTRNRIDELSSLKDQLNSEKAEIVARVTEQYASKIDAVNSGLPSDDEDYVRDEGGLDKLSVYHITIGNKIRELEEEDRQRREEHDAGLQKLVDKKSDCLRSADKESHLLEEENRVRSEIENLRNQKCPTCHRVWEIAEEHLMAHENRLQEIGRDLAQVLSDKAHANDLEKEISEYPDFIPNENIQRFSETRKKVEAKIIEEKSRLDNEERNFKAQKEARKNTILLAVKELEEQRDRQLKHEIEEQGIDHQLETVEAMAEKQNSLVHELEKQVAELKGEKNVVVAKMEANKREHEASTKLLMEAQSAISDYRNRYSTALAKKNKELDFIALSKGFMTNILNEVLSSISDETNRILAAVPNTAHVTFHYETERETKKGSTKLGIVPMVEVSGHDASNIRSGLSGGMMSVVSLAVDLAMRKVVGERTGRNLGWLMLDECFNGLGPNEMQSALEIISEYASDCLVLVVQHASEFQEAFTDRFYVVNENGKSRITHD